MNQFTKRLLEHRPEEAALIADGALSPADECMSRGTGKQPPA
jgi:hypothetical protein